MTLESVSQFITPILIGLVMGGAIGSIAGIWKRIRKIEKDILFLLETLAITQKLAITLGEKITHETPTNN